MHRFYFFLLIVFSSCILIDQSTIVYSEIKTAKSLDDEMVEYIRSGKITFANYEFANGDRYVGEFKSGLKNGFGSYIYKNKEVFIGEFVNEFPRNGMFKYNDGSMYFGDVDSLGRYDNYGTFVSNTNDTLTGLFSQGVLVEEYFTLYKKDIAKELNENSVIKENFLDPLPWTKEILNVYQSQNLEKIKNLSDLIDKTKPVQKSTPEKVYLKLNEREIDYIKENKINSIKGGYCAIKASIGAWEESNEMNAIKHCLWSACATSFIGDEAKTILRNHEYKTSPNKKDMINNAIGISIGKSTNDYSKIQAECKKALSEGKLMVIENDPKFDAITISDDFNISGPKPEASKPEASKPEAPKPESPKPEKPDRDSRPDRRERPEFPKPDRPERTKPDKPESPKPEKPDTPKPEKPDRPKPDKPGRVILGLVEKKIGEIQVTSFYTIFNNN